MAIVQVIKTDTTAPTALIPASSVIPSNPSSVTAFVNAAEGAFNSITVGTVPNINTVATQLNTFATEANELAVEVNGNVVLAKNYATLTGSIVETGTYSSKEHAIGDLTTSGGSAKAWATDTASPDGTTSKSAKTLAAEAAQSAIEAAAAVATLPSGIINDATITLVDAWSSSKINSLIRSLDVSPITTPTITSPITGATDFAGAVTSNTYATSDSYKGTQDYIEWRFATDALFANIVDSYSGVMNLTSYTPAIGLALTEIFASVRKGSDNHLSNWSDTISFTTPNIYIQTPTLTVDGTPSDVTETPTLTTSAFSVFNGTDVHSSTDWQIYDGVTLVWESPADATNKLSIVVPSGILEVSKTYTFKAKHNGTTCVSSAYAETTGTTKASFSIQYGLQWNNIADTYTRLGAAVGWTTGASFTNNKTVQSLMRRCVLNANGTVNYYLSATDSTKKADGVTAADLTGVSGNVMVEIPKFWVKYDNTTSAKQMWISTGPSAGYVVHPSWVKNGVEVDYRYYRAYKCSVSGTKLISRSGAAAAMNWTIAMFRAYAKANGTGWGLVDWNLLFAVQTLLFIEIGTFNSQAVLGNGNDTGTDSMATGGSNSIGNASSPATNDDTWMSYRGIENFYADIYEWIDGINISERLVYTSNTQSTFASDVFSGAYTRTGVTLPSSGYISDMNFSMKGFIPTVATGSGSTYVTDYVNTIAGSCVAAFGGKEGDRLLCGAAFLSTNYTSSYASSDVGAGISF